MQRPFEGNSESSLGTVIQAANPKYPITLPPVSLPCLYAIKDALTADPDKRMGATWDSFIYHDFFSVINFDALERKQIEPIFIPSADKTNFDATYDLEELLLEEAPLEARARRQKPRERLKDDATEKEIREEELYRMIERDFQPFDYTVAAYKKYILALVFFLCFNLANAVTGLRNNRLMGPMASHWISQCKKGSHKLSQQMKRLPHEACPTGLCRLASNHRRLDRIQQGHSSHWAKKVQLLGRVGRQTLIKGGIHQGVRRPWFRTRTLTQTKLMQMVETDWAVPGLRTASWSRVPVEACR